MTKTQIIKKTENYVKKCMKNLPSNHDYKHVDRVRKWAIKIAQAEKKDIFLAEMAALLHDVGRAKEKPPKILHAAIGAKMSYAFLIKNKLTSKKEAEQISYAVAHHGKGGKGWLVKILQDADKMDAFGLIGIIRTAQYAFDLPDYDEKNILGKTKWKKGEATKILKTRKHVGKTIIENLNYIISWYNNLHTKSAKKLAKPFVDYLKQGRKLFIQQIKISRHV